jgi:hypothetical protein
VLLRLITNRRGDTTSGGLGEAGRRGVQLQGAERVDKHHERALQVADGLNAGLPGSV